MWLRQRQTLTLFVGILLLALFVLVPAAGQAQEDHHETVTPVQFNGHSFDLPRSLAAGVTAFIVNQPTESVGGDDTPQPPRTEFRLQLYTDLVAAPPPVAWINVYALNDLEGNPAHQQYERLRQLLSERPDLSGEQTLPTLYPYQQSALPPDRYTEIFMNASYLETEGYRGITFVYGRAIHVGDRQPVLFYRVYFEGISSDNQRYLSAQVEGPPELLESLEGIINPDQYLADAQALFHDPVDEDVIAWLHQANLLFSSFDYSAQS